MPSAAPSGERPLASAGPVLLVSAVGLIAIIGLIVSLFRDPGLPAHVSQGYTSVAGGLVTPSVATPDPAALSAALAVAPPGVVRVPSMQAAGFTLDGGTHVTLGSAPAALAIYHDTQQELLVWHALDGSPSQLPSTADVRTVRGRTFYVHYKATTTLVFWQEGSKLVVVTASLPAEHVVTAAFAAAERRP